MVGQASVVVEATSVLRVVRVEVRNSVLRVANRMGHGVSTPITQVLPPVRGGRHGMASQVGELVHRLANPILQPAGHVLAGNLERVPECERLEVRAARTERLPVVTKNEAQPVIPDDAGLNGRLVYVVGKPGARSWTLRCSTTA
jgi:hypothetical protein